MASKRVRATVLFTAVTMLAFAQAAFAQGEEGINAGTSEIKKYVTPVTNLIIALGGVVALVGGVSVFIAWQNGSQDVGKKLMAWAGSCIFLMLVGAVVKAFFGV
ncbi:DUF4134 domain-containing protein [Pontibacter diazotrophicus]|uniref:DUF4134 domain-containing protein n=2 Tax=Pontibacter diazotrophicus TaxID=1400979 RepID=A0A3D8L4Q1_9BACT|nr:DUF4134 domain-containing protein [Pontibacter diazotrophicus]